jgi:hypothetical protein
MNNHNRIGLNTFSVSTKIFLAVWLLFFILGQSCLAQQKSVQQIIDDFDARVEAGVKADGGGCTMVAVFKGNEIL